MISYDKIRAGCRIIEKTRREGSIFFEEVLKSYHERFEETINLKKVRRINMNDCIFCKIAAGQIPSATVYEDEEFRVILDLNPISEGHALILPKKHFTDITELDAETAAKVLPLAARIGEVMKKALGCTGFNVLQNNGISAGQTVFHFHVHVIPRYEGGPDVVSWKPGKSDPEALKSVAGKLASFL